MGGSSAPPGDLRRKHDTPTRQEREAERFSRLALVRAELHVCRACMELWQVRPDFNRLRLEQAERAISRAIHREDDATVREELDALIEKPMHLLVATAFTYGTHPKTLEAWKSVYHGWKQAYGQERARRKLP